MCHDKPCVRGRRYPVEVLLELLSCGMTFDEILAYHAVPEREGLLAALAALLSEPNRRTGFPVTKSALARK